MNNNADIFGSRLAGQPKHTDQGYQYMAECLKTAYAPTNWSDITIHYYCQMSKTERVLYLRTIGKIDTGRRKIRKTSSLSRLCNGALPESADFAFVTKTQPQIFQYVMFGQTMRLSMRKNKPSSMPSTE